MNSSPRHSPGSLAEIAEKFDSLEDCMLACITKPHNLKRSVLDNLLPLTKRRE
jgi:hypothetical protein